MPTIPSIPASISGAGDTNNDDDNYPTWSPDGRQIAFARFGPHGQKSLYVIPALGGSERRVYSVPAPKYDCNRMDWSPDGTSLIFSEAVDNGTKARLSLLSLSGLTARPLTFPSNQQSDCYPVFSPDGTTVAFARSLLNGFLFSGIALSPDGKSVLFGQRELAESYIMVMKNFR